jgi:hypothetical protein
MTPDDDITFFLSTLTVRDRVIEPRQTALKASAGKALESKEHQLGRKQYTGAQLTRDGVDTRYREEKEKKKRKAKN